MNILKEIRLTCTVCGFSWQPARGYPSWIWEKSDREERLPPKCEIACSNCEADGRPPMTVHFIDYPTEQ